MPWIAPLITVGGSLLAGQLGGQERDQTTTTAPWGPVQQPALGAIGQATQLANTPTPYYPGSTAAPVSQLFTQGLQGAANLARGPSISQQAQRVLPQVWGQQSPFSFNQLQGAYQNALQGGQQTQTGNLARQALSQQAFGMGGPNVQQVQAPGVAAQRTGFERAQGMNIGAQKVRAPSALGFERAGAQRIGTPQQNQYLDPLFNQAANQIQSRLGSQFASGGRTRSGAFQRSYAEQLGNAANQIYGAEATRQADRNLQASQANQQAALNAALANQQAGLTAGQFSRGQQLQSALANQQAGLQAGQSNQANQRALALANQQAGMQTGQFNVAQNLAAQQANQRAALEAQRANQSAGLTGYGLGLQGQQQGTQAAQALLSDEANRASRAQQGLGLANQFFSTNQNLGLEAARLAPQLEQAGYTPYQQLMGLGQADQGQQQRLIDADRARFDFAANEPWQRLSNYLGMIGYGTSPYTQQSTPTYSNPLLGALGTGIQAYSAFNNPGGS